MQLTCFYQFSLGIHNTINIYNHNIAISINHIVMDFGSDCPAN